MTQVVLFTDGNQLLYHGIRIGGQVALGNRVVPDLAINPVVIGIPQVEIRVEAADLIHHDGAGYVYVGELLRCSDVPRGGQPQRGVTVQLQQQAAVAGKGVDASCGIQFRGHIGADDPVHPDVVVLRIRFRAGGSQIELRAACRDGTGFQPIVRNHLQHGVFPGGACQQDILPADIGVMAQYGNPALFGLEPDLGTILDGQCPIRNVLAVLVNVLLGSVGEIVADVNRSARLHVQFADSVGRIDLTLGRQRTAHLNIVRDEAAVCCGNVHHSAVGVLRGIGNGCFRHLGVLAVHQLVDPVMVHIAGSRSQAVIQFDLLVWGIQLHFGDPNTLCRLNIHSGRSGIQIQGIGGRNVSVHGFDTNHAVSGCDIHTGLDVLVGTIHQQVDVEILVGPEDLCGGYRAGAVRVQADHSHIAIQVDGEFAAQNVPGLGIDISGAVINGREAGFHIHPVRADIAAQCRQLCHTVLDQVAAGLELVADAVSVGVHEVVRHNDAAGVGGQVRIGAVGQQKTVSYLNVAKGGDRQIRVVREPAVIVIPGAHIQQLLGIYEVGGEMIVLLDAVGRDLVEVSASFQNEDTGIVRKVTGSIFIRGADVEAVSSSVGISRQVGSGLQLHKPQAVAAALQGIPLAVL